VADSHRHPHTYPHAYADSHLDATAHAHTVVDGNTYA
jgi:hypothetical protein